MSAGQDDGSSQGICCISPTTVMWLCQTSLMAKGMKVFTDKAGWLNQFSSFSLLICIVATRESFRNFWARLLENCCGGSVLFQICCISPWRNMWFWWQYSTKECYTASGERQFDVSWNTLFRLMAEVQLYQIQQWFFSFTALLIEITPRNSNYYNV